MDTNDWISQEASKLSVPQVRIILASSCHYLLPNYIYFFKTEEWGNVGELIRCLKFVVDSSKKNNFQIKTPDEFIDSVYKLTPDLDEFGGAASYAFDAGVAFYETLLYIKDEEFEHATTALCKTFDSVDMFQQEAEEAGLISESEAQEDIYVKREVERYKKIISYIKDKEYFNENDFDYIKHINTSTPYLPIHLLF